MEETTDPQTAVAPPQPDVPAVPTSAADWRRVALARWLIRLPSGVRVKVQRPDFGRLIAEGVISRDDLLKANMANAAEFDALAIRVVPHVVSDPVVTHRNGSKPPADAMAVEDVPFSDRRAILSWVFGVYSLEEEETV